MLTEQNILEALTKLYAEKGEITLPDMEVTQALVVVLYGNKNENGGTLHNYGLNLSPFIRKASIQHLVSKHLTAEEVLKLLPAMKMIETKQKQGE